MAQKTISRQRGYKGGRANSFRNVSAHSPCWGGVLLPRYDLIYTRSDARVSVLKRLHFTLSEPSHQKRTASVWFSLRAQALEAVPQRFLDGCARVVGEKHQFCEIRLRHCVRKLAGIHTLLPSRLADIVDDVGMFAGAKTQVNRS